MSLKGFFPLLIIPLNFHVHVGVGGWAAACVCENFHEIPKLRNYTAPSFSKNG